MSNVKIITIGKSEWSSGNDNWISGGVLPVLVDPSPNNIWASWEASLRDLFFIDEDGNYFTHYNITDMANVDEIQNTINTMLENLSLKLLPESISLINAYPNPFNPITNISFSVHEGSDARITIFDIKGRLVESISNSFYYPGSYVLTWDATHYSSGIYIVKLNSGITTLNHKIVLSK